MKNLKSNRLCILSFLFLFACQSAPVFEIKTFPKPPQAKLDDHHVIRVKSNRIQQECLFFNAEAENKWRHQYFMYILTDKDEVLPIMHVINQDGETCQKQLRKIQKVLKQEAHVKVCANSDLEKIKKFNPEDTPIQFEQLGKYKVAYEPLFLDSICNSKDCFIYKDLPYCTDVVKN